MPSPAPAPPQKKVSKLVKFAPKGEQKFYDALKVRVDEYFRSQGISPQANHQMRIKSVVMISLYFIPYIFIVTGLASASPFIFYSLWILMGVGIVGIGTCIMHDSNHGSYSRKPAVNYALGGLLNIIGGYSRNWRIQHNILHHTYTNVTGLDEDIAGTPLIRMSPHSPLLKIHRYQAYYAWFLYAMMNLVWVVIKDYRLIFHYEREGLLKKEKVSLSRAFLEVTAYRIFYIGYIIVLPGLFSGMSWGSVILGFLLMQMVAGLFLALIFQPAHVMETSEFPVPDDERKMENSWAVHQLLNTTNFAPGSRITSWFMGGLNYQIEHHLFPQICHIHYQNLAPIVKETAELHGLKYNVVPTVFGAIVEHGKMLHALRK